MLLNNKKVARFLGFDYAQFCKLLKTNTLSIGAVLRGNEKNRYYILACDLERYIERKLTESEKEFLYAKNKRGYRDSQDIQ